MAEVKVDGAGIQTPQGATVLHARDQADRRIVELRGRAMEAAK